VTNLFGEKLKNFVKPLADGGVLLLSMEKMAVVTCRWRIMCLMETVASGFLTGFVPVR